jgi:hypothetical protein
VTRTIEIKPSGWKVIEQGSIEPAPIQVASDTAVPNAWVPPANGSRPAECAIARDSRDRAADRIKRMRAASKRAHGSAARRRLEAGIRRQATALRAAQRQVGRLCGPA